MPDQRYYQGQGPGDACQVPHCPPQYVWRETGKGQASETLEEAVERRRRQLDGLRNAPSPSGIRPFDLDTELTRLGALVSAVEEQDCRLRGVLQDLGASGFFAPEQAFKGDPQVMPEEPTKIMRLNDLNGRLDRSLERLDDALQGLQRWTYGDGNEPC